MERIGKLLGAAICVAVTTVFLVWVLVVDWQVLGS
jgi:hypothetical protein